MVTVTLRLALEDVCSGSHTLGIRQELIALIAVLIEPAVQLPPKSGRGMKSCKLPQNNET